MTKKKDLKKRVRERKAKTGESYTAALLHVRGPRKGGPLIREAPDATAEAVAEGLRCTAIVSAALRALPDLRPLFARLREMLEALDADACGALLRGEAAPPRIPVIADVPEARRFLASVRAGSRGLSRDGRLFALSWQGRTVVGWMFITGSRKPLLQLGFLDDAGGELTQLAALIGLGR